MLTLISWRNVWRSKARTFVVIGAIILGIWALTLAMGFVEGFMRSYVENAINTQYAHLQIHQPEFQSNQDLKFTIPEGKELTEAIRANQNIASVTARTVIQGMVSSAETASGGQIYGIDPDAESEVFVVDESLEEGHFFEESVRNPVVIGNELAEKLNVKLKSKIVLTFTDPDGNITSGAFRIAGIFNTRSPALNQTAVYVLQKDLTRLLGGEPMIHEIAIRVKNLDQLTTVKQTLENKYEQVKVQTWQELAPELELITNQSSTSLIILLVIIMLALGFGIVNTMLMAVLERVKELGMLMAVGMNKIRVFLMIILETMIIAFVGAPLGLLLGFATVKFYQVNGLDLSNYARGLDKFGYATIIYPELDLEFYFIMTAGVVITALLGSVYPALKAIKLKPVEALNKL